MKKIKLALLIIIPLLLNGCSPIKGEKTGEIISLNQEGYIFKTNEAELIKGNLSNGSGAFGKPFYFTITSPKVLKIANEAFEQNKAVIVTYTSTLFCPFSSETSNCIFAKSIKIIK